MIVYIDAKQMSVTDGNGKRTLDIDSFGNVSLDVNKLLIRSQSVATEGYVGNQLNSYPTTETVNSAIEQSATAIKNTVSETYYTKNDIDDKGFATTSQLTQTANAFEYKFSQSGGYNLILNGNPKPYRTENWWITGNAWWYQNNPTVLGLQSTETTGTYCGTAIFPVEAGQTYSFSCWLMVEANLRGTNIYFVGSANEDWAYTHTEHIFNSGPTGWIKVEKTFTIPTNINYGFIRIDHNGVNTNPFNVVWFKEVMLVKGHNMFPQWSPNPNEIHEGITTIDRYGSKVTASNINGYTQMTVNGFFVNKDGKDLVSVDGYGLRLFDAKIQLTHANGNKYFLLDENGIAMYNPANGVHRWGIIGAINSKFTVASDGNSSGLSLGHHVNGSYVEDIYCDSGGTVHIQRQAHHNGIYRNYYGQMFIQSHNSGGWEFTGRPDSQSIKPTGANQGSLGSNTQYLNNSWVANRNNPSSLEFKHLSHYIDDLECLKLVSEIQPARYFYKEFDEEGNDVTTFTTRNSQIGLIYEDVRECAGRDYLTNEEDKAINDYNMASVLWGAVRNLNARLNEAEGVIVTLQQEIEELKKAAE